MYTISTFYRFFAWPEFASFRGPLQEFCAENEIIGTILLAPEGINATVSSYVAGSLDRLMTFLGEDPRMADLETKVSHADEAPFGRMRVRLKRELISIRNSDADPLRHVGEYVAPEDWNALIQDPEVVLLDTRNTYEVEAGTFEGAIDPEIASFGDFPDYVKANLDPTKNKKVAMFCTGGIRCEKSTALLLSWGFEKVYHLQGGILKYLNEIPSEESLFRGECWVFDDRVTYKDGVSAGIWTKTS